jgi:hypothetical protein
MYNTVDYLTCSPGERRLAFYAPHLIATVDLVDVDATARAIFCVFFQEFHSFNVGFFTNVLVGFRRAFDSVAMAAHLRFTDGALVVSIQETVTLFLGACHFKLRTIGVFEVYLIVSAADNGVV